MSVVSYLDCGCAILSDGGREWCPTCAAKLEGSYQKPKLKLKRLTIQEIYEKNPHIVLNSLDVAFGIQAAENNFLRQLREQRPDEEVEIE